MGKGLGGGETEGSPTEELAGHAPQHEAPDASDVAPAYRCALGEIPLEDELPLSQSAALLTWPLVEAYLWQEGPTDGLVLCLRRGFFSVQCGVSAVVCLALRTLGAGPGALVIATLPLPLLPRCDRNRRRSQPPCGGPCISAR